MQRERGVAAAGFDRWDLCCLALFVVLWYALLVFRYDALPLQAWDESRQAVTSYEMATGHGWLAPTYEGAPDHYNTKPPLLVWSIAALMRLGLPLVLAIRLPVFLAVLSTVVLVWAVGRFGLRDRAAGVIAALLLFSSQLYFGIHVGRTGDFDALLSLFEACGVFAFWLAVWRAGRVRLGWFAGIRGGARACGDDEGDRWAVRAGRAVRVRGGYGAAGQAAAGLPGLADHARGVGAVFWLLLHARVV